jgi:hypothetical protein
MGIQAWQRQLQARRSRWPARDQATCVAACAHSSRLFLSAQGPHHSASCWPSSRATDAGPGRVTPQCPRAQYVRYACANAAVRRHLRLPQSKDSGPDGGHAAMSSGMSKCRDRIDTANMSISGIRSSQIILWPWCQTRKIPYTRMVRTTA